MKNLIDVHTHLAAFPDGDNKCYMSPSFEKGTLVKLVRWKLGLTGNTNKEINQKYVDKLLHDIKNSTYVKKVVLLALDGVYDDKGELDKEKTHMLISNEAVFSLSAQHPDQFLPGASVNPKRKDAIDELNRVIERGAKLIKVLPPSQVFDPMDDRYKSFYRILAEKKVPLLCHIGYEFSVTAGKQEYGFPNRLELALDQGVDVIGAHACSSAIFFQGAFRKMLWDLVNRFPNFYMDLSATTLPNRASILFHLKKHPELFDRFLFGSDYPLSAYATPFLGRIRPLKQLKLWGTRNIFDKQAGILEELGIKINPETTNKLIKLNENKTSSFIALLATQFFGAFNDNYVKIVIGLLVTNWVLDPVAQNRWVSTSLFVFAAPFILFSLGAGRLADRLSKQRIIVGTKIFESLVILIALCGVLLQNIPVLMGSLFLLGAQSAFFGPSKYGILPELIDNKGLSNANAYLNVSTVIAILVGSIAGTLTVGNTGLVLSIMLFITISGLISSLMIEKMPAINPEQRISWNFISDFSKNWGLVKDNLVLRRSLVAVSYFWFVGAILQGNTIVYVKNSLKASDQTVGLILFIITAGVALGSLLAGKMSKEKVELGFVPLGAFGMSFFTMDIYFAGPSMIRAGIDIFFVGFSSGLFTIPLTTLIQSRSPEAERGRVVAFSNFLSFVAIILAGGFLWLTGTALKFSPTEVFLSLGLLSFLVALVICFFIPQSVIRLILYILTNTIYRIRVIGRENIPITGPALLVPNHVSMVDPFLVAGGMSRSVRFLMFKHFYEKWWIRPIVKLMEAIPISSTDNPKEIMRSLLLARKKLDEGHVVCIFAEGQISRLGGVTLGFQRGLEVILKGKDVPVIPVHLEGVWGSIFSFKNKKFIWKWPKKLPYPVTVTFGKPLHNPLPGEVRHAVMELGSEAFSAHRKNDPTLFSSFLRQAKRNMNQKIVADSSGKELSYHKVLAGMTLLGKNLDQQLKSTPQASKNVGVLLPPSIGAVLANLSLVSQGYLPINLNYTLSEKDIEAICKKASITSIVTSEKILKKLGWEIKDSYLVLEPYMAQLKTSEKIWAGLLTKLLPRKILEKTLFRKAEKNLDDLASIMFTSGSTGIPKGVMLTEANILSNLQSLEMILHVQSSDVILGVLPFFHSFGYTASLWFPLVAGFKAVYHFNPLDSKTIGNLSRDHKVTFLIGTPTFLTAYMRRIDKKSFSHLRFAVAGAEKLRPELARSFEEKYAVPILEGYGCTELSPVVAVNVPDIMDGEILQVGRKVGKIGRPIPGVSVKIVDPETFAERDPGKEGLLLVKGPNVMKGYLDEPDKTAQVMRGPYYITGDIATIDPDGFIQITDRLSRFSKIGGEMVPHIKVEEKLQELAETSERQFVVTSVSDPKKGEALVVIVAGYKGAIEELWKKLNSSGLPNLWVPSRDKFFEIESIPLLGSGKVDIQAVKKLAAEKTNSN